MAPPKRQAGLALPAPPATTTPTQPFASLPAPPPAMSLPTAPAETPLEAALRPRKASSRTEEQNRLFHAWNEGGRTKELLSPLLDTLQPSIQAKARQLSAGAKMIDPAAAAAVIEKHYIAALPAYDPQKGALSTHFAAAEHRAARELGDSANVAYIPTDQRGRIGHVKRTAERLEEDLGRQATSAEIAKELGGRTTPKHIDRLLGRGGHNKELKGDIAHSAFEEDPTQQSSNRFSEMVPLLHSHFQSQKDDGTPVFHPRVANVFEHLHGLNGKPQVTSTGEIAKRTGLSAPQVSQIRKTIDQEMAKYR